MHNTAPSLLVNRFFWFEKNKIHITVQVCIINSYKFSSPTHITTLINAILRSMPHYDFSFHMSTCLSTSKQNFVIPVVGN